MLNRKYGKIENGGITYAPSELPSTVTDDDGNKVNVTVYNPSDYLYQLCGYKPIVEEPYPSDRGFYDRYFREENGSIYIRYREAELPPMPPTLEEQVEATAEAITELAELIGGMI